MSFYRIALALFFWALAGQAVTVSDLAATASFTADDGSIIRNLPGLNGVEAVHCALPRGQTIRACRHKTVGQIWYVTGGLGEMWLKDSSGKESLFSLRPGISFTVPLGYAFQFRNRGTQDLEILIVNTSPWSGAGELIPVAGHWPN